MFVHAGVSGILRWLKQNMLHWMTFMNGQTTFRAGECNAQPKATTTSTPSGEHPPITPQEQDQ